MGCSTELEYNMGGDSFIETDEEILPSMWPEDLENEARKQFNIEKPNGDQDMLEDVDIKEDPTVVDFKRLLELTNYSEKGSTQLAYLVKQWEYRQANAVRLLNEELGILKKQRQEAELKKLEILEQHRFEEKRYGCDKRPVSIMGDVMDLWEAVPRRRNEAFVYNRNFEIDAKNDTIKYWKQRAMQVDKILEVSIKREQVLMEKLQENIKNLEGQTSPVEELSQILKRADNFLHFVLQNAPVVIGHQDKELRYRFIYNHFPSLAEEDIIGKTDVEIFSGDGVKEIQDFKKEVLERGQSAKREITFETELFGSKTFLIYVEPVFSKAGDTIGVNYMGMEVTDQVIKREKIAKIREEMAVQNAKEKELKKTIHITEETMRAKQMLATMSHEIRSPLTGVVSMAEILANTKLDKEQRQLLDVMISSGDLVLQLINDILDLSKVESGVMKLEATKFRPREVVKHVLQTAAASLQKDLTLEGHVAEDVPLEVIGDVLRIRQILTNLISNAIKFTHEGNVGINVYVTSNDYPCQGDRPIHTHSDENNAIPTAMETKEYCSMPQSCCRNETSHCLHCQEVSNQHDKPYGNESVDDKVKGDIQHERSVMLRFDVYDTGIGIPESALPTLFKKYMQASAAHARKYGGTGLGLAICKQLVELMGGHITVSSKENCGSLFTFVLPCKVSEKVNYSDDSDGMSDIIEHESPESALDESNRTFVFKPSTLGSQFPHRGSLRCTNKILSGNNSYDALDNLGGMSEKSSSSSPRNSLLTKKTSPHDDGLVPNAADTLPCSVSHDQETDVDVVMKTKGRCSDETSFTMNRFHGSSPDCGMKPENVDNNPCKVNFQSNILLVEDNKINIMVAKSMMKQLGHNIDVANNGLEAIKAVQCSNYDLILMDVCMPVMDGLQATRFIRSFEENGFWDTSLSVGNDKAILDSRFPTNVTSAGQHRKRIPIIAMTANALAESAAECLANGMDSFVTKPVTFQKLKQCLQQYLPC